MTRNLALPFKAFLTLLTLAALTAAISLLEVVSAYLIDEHGWGRTQASWVLGTLIFLLGTPSGPWEELFGFMDGMATNYLLPIKLNLPP